MQIYQQFIQWQQRKVNYVITSINKRKRDNSNSDRNVWQLHSPNIKSERDCWTTTDPLRLFQILQQLTSTQIRSDIKRSVLIYIQMSFSSLRVEILGQFKSRDRKWATLHARSHLLDSNSINRRANITFLVHNN